MSKIISSRITEDESLRERLIALSNIISEIIQRDERVVGGDISSLVTDIEHNVFNLAVEYEDIKIKMALAEDRITELYKKLEDLVGYNKRCLTLLECLGRYPDQLRTTVGPDPMDKAMQKLREIGEPIVETDLVNTDALDETAPSLTIQNTLRFEEDALEEAVEHAIVAYNHALIDKLLSKV